VEKKYSVCFLHPTPTSAAGIGLSLQSYRNEWEVTKNDLEEHIQ
jgi:hypothetical protein